MRDILKSHASVSVFTHHQFHYIVVHIIVFLYESNCQPSITVQQTAMYIHEWEKRKYIAVNGISSHSYEVSLAIWDNTVLPATRHKWAHPALTAAIQAGTRFTYPGGMEG